MLLADDSLRLRPRPERPQGPARRACKPAPGARLTHPGLPTLPRLAFSPGPRPCLSHGIASALCLALPLAWSVDIASAGLLALASAMPLTASALRSSPALPLPRHRLGRPPSPCLQLCLTAQPRLLTLLGPLALPLPRHRLGRLPSPCLTALPDGSASAPHSARASGLASPTASPRPAAFALPDGSA